MEIAFRTKALYEVLNSSKSCQKKFGSVANKLMQRMTELRNAENLQDIKITSSVNGFEQLTNNLKGECSIKPKKVEKWRIIFVPVNGALLDLLSVTKIEIIEISDHYKR
jgi:plasmid maintenance system killer protein